MQHACKENRASPRVLRCGGGLSVNRNGDNKGLLLSPSPPTDKCFLFQTEPMPGAIIRKVVLVCTSPINKQMRSPCNANYIL